MKSFTKIVITILFVIWSFILLYIGYNNTFQIKLQKDVIISLNSRIDLLEYNHMSLVESVSRWSKENNAFNDELMNRIKKADDFLDRKIDDVSKFDVVVIERLKSISESQSELIKAIIGLSSTNAVDISH